MSPQREAGLVCSLLTAAVVVNYLIKGEVGAFFWFCVGVLALCLVTLVWENVVVKALQMGLLFAVGGVLQFHGDSSGFIGVVIICVAVIHCHVHGFLENGIVAKGIMLTVGLIVVVGIGTEGNVQSMIMRAVLSATLVVMIRIPMKVMIKKTAESKEAEARGRMAPLVEAASVIATKYREDHDGTNKTSCD